MTTNKIPSPRAALIDRDGRMSPEWYRYFAGKERSIDSAAEGEVVAGDGLDGGGAVSDGVTLSVEDNGIADDMLRQGGATSVIGRFQNSTGNVADIQATANYRWLGRVGDQLAFRPLVLETFTVATLPSAAIMGAGTLVYVSDESGGAIPAFSDGTNWRRVTDRAVVT